MTGSDETALAAIQSAVEGVPRPAKVELACRWFRIAAKIGVMPLMKFAHAADSGVDTGDLGALSAVYDMLRDCIDPADWQAFERHAIDVKADADELLPVVQQVVEILAARPTPPPSGSPDGRPVTSASSTASSCAAPAPASTGSPHGRPATSPSPR